MPRGASVHRVPRAGAQRHRRPTARAGGTYASMMPDRLVERVHHLDAAHEQHPERVPAAGRRARPRRAAAARAGDSRSKFSTKRASGPHWYAPRPTMRACSAVECGTCSSTMCALVARATSMSRPARRDQPALVHRVLGRVAQRDELVVALERRGTSKRRPASRAVSLGLVARRSSSGSSASSSLAPRARGRSRRPAR